MVEDGRPYAAHALLVLFHVSRVTPAADPLQLGVKLRRIRDRGARPALESGCDDLRNLRLAREREDRLADPSAVERHSLADPRPHLERVRALDLIQVDDVPASSDTEVHGLLGPLGDCAQDRLRLLPNVQPLVHGHPELEQGDAEPVALGFRILLHKSLADESGEEPVGGALLKPALLRELGEANSPGRAIALERLKNARRPGDGAVFRNWVAHSGTSRENLELSSVKVKYDVERTARSLEQLRVIGIARLRDAEAVVAGATAAAEHGLRALEVPFTVPDAPRAIAALRERLAEDAVLGAGTVRTSTELEAAVDAGAQFLVAPGLNPELVRVANRLGILIVPGVYTASEVDQALTMGLRLLKLFPAMPAGPEYMAALLQPFPEARFVPTGGVGPENARAFLDAGAAALAMGSSVFPSRRIEREGASVAGPLAAAAVAAVTA